MRGGPPGTPCSLTIDFNSPVYENGRGTLEPAPEAGMFLVSEAGSAYEVQAVHHVHSERHPFRFRLRCLRFERGRIPPDAHVVEFVWNSR